MARRRNRRSSIESQLGRPVCRFKCSVCVEVPTTHGRTGIFFSQGRIHCYKHPLYEQLKEAPQLLQEDPLTSTCAHLYSPFK